jgi:hypothetical protein
VLISQRVANAVWRMVLRLRPSHLVLRLTGEAIVVGIIAGWALLRTGLDADRSDARSADDG